MDTQYEDYYSQYKETHEKVNNAFDLASSEEVSRNLKENISNATEKIGRCKIGGENDNIISSYNEVVNSYLERLDNLYAFSSSYFDVETVYCHLRIELEELKEYDGVFREKSQQQPSKSDSKYAITNDDGTPGSNEELYNRDLNNWKKEVSNYKKCCKELAENVQNFLDYLTLVNGFDPKEGKIKVADDRPYVITGNELLNKYSYEIDYDFIDENIIESYVLEGEELEKFISTNYISNAEYATVYKRTVMLNGVVVNTYAVFDKDRSPKKNELFEKSIKKSLAYESKIDPAILAKIFTGENASSIIFMQSVRFEENTIYAPAYYSPATGNITMLYLGDGLNNYNVASIVHETGHAYDYRLGMEINDGQSGCYSENLNWKEIILSEVNYFDSTHSNECCIPGFDSEEAALNYYNSYCLNATGYEMEEYDGKWEIKVSYENPVTPDGVTINNGGKFGYNVHDYVEKPCEYFADSFEAYWLGDMESEEEGGISKLEFLCPKTYAELQRLIENEKNNYHGGK
jgi:hypothetical protein